MVRWSGEAQDGYSSFGVEKAEIKAVNRFADKLDVQGFMEWLAANTPRDRYAIVCRLIGYGCEYNKIVESLDAFSPSIRPLVEHMKSSAPGISQDLGWCEEFGFDYVSQLSEGAFREVAEWTFLFYARNNNWRKFPELQP